jgi:hypothetical protein
MSWPPLAATTSAMSVLCRARAMLMAALWVSHNGVEPSMSVSRKVTIPSGSSADGSALRQASLRRRVCDPHRQPLDCYQLMTILPRKEGSRKSACGAVLPLQRSSWRHCAVHQQWRSAASASSREGTASSGEFRHPTSPRSLTCRSRISGRRSAHYAGEIE